MIKSVTQIPNINIPSNIEQPANVPEKGSVETISPLEVTPTVKPATKDDDNKKGNPVVIPAPKVNPQPIQNKTSEKRKLHSIIDSKDTLTTLADKEEEEFIENVEAAHGHSD